MTQKADWLEEHNERVAAEKAAVKQVDEFIRRRNAQAAARPNPLRDAHVVPVRIVNEEGA